jgi:hypothetical protein
MATRTLSAAGGNWNSNATWDEGAFPVAGDDVVVRADGTSGNLTVTAQAFCQSIDLTAGDYNGTFVINSGQLIIITGNITLNSSGTCTGITAGSSTGGVDIRADSTITSNGKTFACRILCTSTGKTLTLADNLTQTTGFLFIGGTIPVQISGNYTWSTAYGITATTGATQINSGCTLKVVGGTIVGSITTATRIFTGAGTLEFAGDITVTTNPLNLKDINFKYTSGTITDCDITTQGNVVLSGGGSFRSLTALTSGTVTLDTDITFTNVTLGNGAALTMSGAKKVTTTTLNFNGSNNTLTLANIWDVTTINTTSTTAVTAKIVGAYDLTIANLIISTGAASSLEYQCGQTLTVTDSIHIEGTIAYAAVLKSCTASSPFDLVLTGITAANRQVFYATFTDVDVTGGTLYNYHGQTLTRTNGITNFTDPSGGGGAVESSYGFIY